MQNVKSGHITVVAAIIICMAHVFLLPYIFFGVSRVQPPDRIDIAMLIGPMTASYFITIVKFGIDNRYQKLVEDSKPVNSLFIFVSFVCVVPFIVALYALIYLYESASLSSVNDLKRGIGVVELFFGSSFAIFANSLFGSQ